MIWFLLLISTYATQVGYITVNPSQNGRLFYWITESQGNIQTDPVVFWISGGPGCSGELALFYENGPWSINSNLTLTANPYSWNKVATVIYLDQPVGTGYSYANSLYVHDEKGVATDMAVFFTKFFQQYPQYKTQDLFISGESYGGKYVPTMAKVILDLNKQNPNSPLNLKGISIGNGVIQPYFQTPSQGQAAWDAKLINETVWQQIQQISKNCQNLIDAKKWDQAEDQCENVIITVLQAAGDINPMNYKQHCKIQDCFIYDNQTKYLNLDGTKAALGIPSNISWQACNMDISFTAQDQMDSFVWEVTDLLDAGLVVLSYYGNLDLVAPYQGGKKWMLNTDWNGKVGFGKAHEKLWKLKGEVVGRSKAYKNFIYVEVFEAGHMAPHDQPEASLDLFNRFIHLHPW